jgi:hypothetical protein
MKILNLTQHLATEEQKTEGVIDLPLNLRVQLGKLLTFATLEDALQAHDRAQQIFDFLDENYEWEGTDGAMIGGALFLMHSLVAQLYSRSMKAFYAFTLREVIEIQNDDGSVTKTAIFKHAGLVPA